MNKKTLARATKKINRLRGSEVQSKKLENIAESLGRVRRKKAWVSELLPGSRPIIIHSHGKLIPRFTAESILDDLERDIFDLEELLEK